MQQLISEVFGGLNFFSLSGFLFFLLRKSGLMFNSPVTTPIDTWLTPTGLVPRVAACNAVQMPLFISLNPPSCDASKHLTWFSS